MSHHHDERGVVGGADAVALGVLVLVVGSLIIVNAWAVIDTRSALDAAAREYLRAYTEADDAGTARLAGESAARSVLHQRGTPLTGLVVTPPDGAAFGPCASASVELAVTVPAVRLPFVGGMGSTVAAVRHRELVDGHREVERGPAYDPALTACG